jgi:hypothetical protein
MRALISKVPVGKVTLTPRRGQQVAHELRFERASSRLWVEQARKFGSISRKGN